MNESNSDEIRPAQPLGAARNQERHSRRVNLLIKPSVLDCAAKLAHMKKVSVNKLLNVAVEQYVDSHRHVIAEYDRLLAEFKNLGDSDD
ncbi:MAG: hypothetical protein LBU32_31410 [Clostridiales bacterium]|nr:hypothetical protein [Clostridiales bacterium]